MYAIGIDIGSTGTKGVLWRDGIVDEELLPTGWNHREAGLRALQTLLSRQGIGKGDVACVVATGYGRKTADFADTTVTEITCHAKGAAWLLPEAKSVLDIGGQDSKAILLGSSGDVVDFLMNDKCAAGCILQEGNPPSCKVFSPVGGWGIFTLPGASGTPSPGCLGHQRAAGTRDESGDRSWLRSSVHRRRFLPIG